MFSSIAKDTFFGKAGDSWSLASLDLEYPAGDMLTSIYSSFLAPSDQDKIDVIGVDTRAIPENSSGLLFGDSRYNDLLSAYTLPQVLTMYGVPAQVFVTADIYEYEQDAPDFFEIRLLYPEQGIFATYRMPAETASETYRFCPLKSFVHLDLASPGQEETYQELLPRLGDKWDGFFPPTPFNKTPEEALEMTREEFYDTLHAPSDQCLESQKSIWPGR